MVTNLETESNLETDEIRDLDDLKKEIKLNRDSDNIEQIEKPVESQVIIEVVSNYIKNKIKDMTNYYLKDKKKLTRDLAKQAINYLWSRVKNEISNELKNYLANHHILKIWKDKKIYLEMNDASKKDFIITSKKLLNIVKNKIKNNFFLNNAFKLISEWKENIVDKYHDEIYKYLGKLDENLSNMSEKDYKKLVFSDIWGIIKKIILKIWWKMTIWELFNYFSDIYPTTKEKKENILKQLNRDHLPESETPIYSVQVTEATYKGERRK